ncbi:uncharacterized protein LOC116293456 [Actinia tenebrosa]|uniref:Uncharacterized protein LOC116293456 n=1 Tax=Actinia tenebrosa TaxID=6105 RepID=A0A6P8HVX3_ACTTE|nr:uncharacterized protein LOC116293456 [Actinia tenebrosa]XP_031556743.1 uncharacterized protein LOC116293456 [Actinia tenebrosa]
MADKDSLGPEALLRASSDCKYRLIRLLIEGGTLTNVRNENQETPLILACKSESEEKEKVVDYLIRKRVKVNLQDIHGRTALMHACLTNSSDNIIRMLVNSKANPWLVDEGNNTSFDYAINAGNIGAVKLMIQACREGKILTKPGSFNIEMKKLEDRLDEMPEIRKCSWPLMGPRISTGKEKRNTNQSNLLAVSEVDEFTESPTRERRRKRSICHFDPIGLEASEGSSEGESTTKPLRRASLASASRSASEDERISLHFSDSDNSSFDRSSTNFSSLEKLLRMRDSVTSSVDSTDSLNAQNLQIKVEGITEEESSKNSEIFAVAKCTRALDEMLTKEREEHSRKKINDNKNSKDVEKLNQSQTDLKYRSEKTGHSDGTQETCAGVDRKKKLSKEYEVQSTQIGQSRNELMKSSCALPCGMSAQNQESPRTPRRRTVGTSTPSQKGDVIEDWERKTTGNETEAMRRFTLGAMDLRSDDKRRSLNLWGEEHNLRPSPPPRDLSRTPITVVTSPEMKSFRKKIRSPEVDFSHGRGPFEHAQELGKKNGNENAGVHTTHNSAKGRKLDASKTELKTNAPLPFNLPVISPLDNIGWKGKEREGKESGKNSQVEKTAVRRTLSDSVSHERRRASASGTRHVHHSNGKEESSSACVIDSTAGTTKLVTRERSSSFTPLSTTASTTGTPPQERKASNVSPCCDIVTMATSSTGEPLRCHSPRNKLSSDLPDLVLHTPRSRGRSPSNLDPFSLAPELHVSDQYHTRYARSVPSSSETLNPTGSQSYLTGSHNHLPEVVSSTTGSPKQRRLAFLPPLNISRKQQDQPEEGYFSCSPSPLDVESSSRSKEKSKYSFKPPSPRLVNRPVKNLLP